MLPEHAIVMHPGPMNRGLEISADAADSPRAVIVEQVANGVAVRMAVLYLLLAGERRGMGHDATCCEGSSPLGGQPTDLLLDDGRIAASGREARGAAGATVVDGDGLVALPGLVDLHTHLREPGREDAETVETRHPGRGARRATPRSMRWRTPPRSPTPPASSSRSGASDAMPGGRTCTRSGRSASASPGEQLAELGAMAHSAARVRVFSDDGHCVHDPVLMRRALEYVKAFDGVDRAARSGAAAHRRTRRCTRAIVSAELGLAGWPAVAEEAIVARDVLLAEHVGSRLHVCTSPPRARST